MDKYRHNNKLNTIRAPKERLRSLYESTHIQFLRFVLMSIVFVQDIT